MTKIMNSLHLLSQFNVGHGFILFVAAEKCVEIFRIQQL